MKIIAIAQGFPAPPNALAFLSHGDGVDNYVFRDGEMPENPRSEPVDYPICGLVSGKDGVYRAVDSLWKSIVGHGKTPKEAKADLEAKIVASVYPKPDKK